VSPGLCPLPPPAWQGYVFLREVGHRCYLAAYGVIRIRVEAGYGNSYQLVFADDATRLVGVLTQPRGEGLFVLSWEIPGCQEAV
jgi:hypothetical protein